VCARWNPTVTEALLASALEALRSHGAREEDVTVVRVPGAFELPAAARALLRRRCDAPVVLAAAVEGGTSHNEVLAHPVAGGLASRSAETGAPRGFGFLTCDTMDQARRRVGKGAEAAEAAVEVANLRRALARK